MEGSSHSPATTLGLLAWTTEVQHDTVGVAVTTIRGLIKEARAGLAAGRVDAARLRWATAAGLRWQSEAGAMGELASIATSEPSVLEALRTLPARAAAVGPAEVAGTLERCSGHEVVAIVGPVALAKRQVEGLVVLP